MLGLNEISLVFLSTYKLQNLIQNATWIPYAFTAIQKECKKIPF